MKTRNQMLHRHQPGYVLIEAMVALIVVAVGILGVAKLNALLAQSTGYTKTRAEALQIAQRLVEQLRNYDLADGCAGVVATGLPTSVTGTNANFEIATTLANIGTSAKTVQVCVTWDGGDCAATGNRILLNSAINCTGLGTSAQVGTEANGGGGRSGFVKTPTGRGQVGGRDYGSVPTGAVQNQIPGAGNDTTYTYTNPDDKTRELISNTGKVLLSVKKRDCESAAPDFSTVSGKVFVKADKGAPIVEEDHLFVLSSDASYCSRLPFQNSWVMPTGATGNSIEYFYTYYKCYIGAEWWGNVSPIRTDNPNANNRTCVGSPSNSNNNTSSLFSKRPQISSNRAYRGYRESVADSGVYESVGIGETNDLHPTCPNQKVYKPQHLENHHFVHTVITGQATDASCTTVETTLNGITPTNSLGTGTSAPTSSTDTSTGAVTLSANNNPGKFYCLSNADGVTCPNLTQNIVTPTTLLRGTITAQEAGAVVNGISSSNLGGSCSTVNFNLIGSNQYSYSCQINWTGFSGQGWYGAISFDMAGSTTACGPGTATVTPSTLQVAYTINSSTATSNANSIVFTDIPTSVTELVLNFDVKAASCNRLDTPDVSVPKGSDNTISWSAITSANNYKIFTCTVDGTSFCTIPATATSTQTALSYSFTAPTANTVDNRTYCLQVQAINTTGSPTDSLLSTKKCLRATKKNKTQYTWSTVL